MGHECELSSAPQPSPLGCQTADLERSDLCLSYSPLLLRSSCSAMAFNLSYPERLKGLGAGRIAGGVAVLALAGYLYAYRGAEAKTHPAKHRIAYGESAVIGPMS